MKIAWFTPFSKESAIGLYSKIACEALSKYCDIEIYSPNDRFRETFLSVQPLDSLNISKLNQFDAVIYNMGNFYPYHAEIFDISKQVPGIFILHDLSMLDFMYGYFTAYKNDIAGLHATLKQLYSEPDATMILNAACNSETWKCVDFIKYNAIEWITENARGAIVHSRYHLNCLKKHYSGFSAMAYFPYAQEKGISPAILQERRDGKIELLTVGHVNPNKQIAQVLDAIGTNSQIRDRIHYNVVGGLGNQEYCNYLQRKIQKYHLEDVVCLNGYATDEELECYYQNADVLINLRNPAIEGASWSLVEQMWRGKPIMVTDIGFYAEMPNDCVYKISPEPEIEIKSIQNVILSLLNDRTRLGKTGKNAQIYAQERFSPEQYVKTIVPYLQNYQYIASEEDLIDDVIHEFSIMKLYGYTELYKQYANDIAQLFSQI